MDVENVCKAEDVGQPNSHDDQADIGVDNKDESDTNNDVGELNNGSRNIQEKIAATAEGGNGCNAAISIVPVTEDKEPRTTEYTTEKRSVISSEDGKACDFENVCSDNGFTDASENSTDTDKEMLQANPTGNRVDESQSKEETDTKKDTVLGNDAENIEESARANSLSGAEPFENLSVENSESEQTLAKTDEGSCVDISPRPTVTTIEDLNAVSSDIPEEVVNGFRDISEAGDSIDVAMPKAKEIDVVSTPINDEIQDVSNRFSDISDNRESPNADTGETDISISPENETEICPNEDFISSPSSLVEIDHVLANEEMGQEEENSPVMESTSVEISNSANDRPTSVKPDEVDFTYKTESNKCRTDDLDTLVSVKLSSNDSENNLKVSPTSDTGEDTSGTSNTVIILNLQPDDFLNLRLSQLSDISEENDLQPEDIEDSGETYQALESGIAQEPQPDCSSPGQSGSTCAVTIDEGDALPAERLDTEGEDYNNSAMDISNPDDTSVNVKGEGLSDPCSEQISTEAVIETIEPADKSESPGYSRDLERDTIEDEGTSQDDGRPDEERQLLVPKAVCDPIDLIDDYDNSVPPDTTPEVPTSGATPDPHTNAGVQKVAKAFLQTRYKNMSKKRMVYTTVIKYVLFFFNFICWVVGVSAAGAGYWMIADKHKVVRDALDFFLDPAIILCISGFIIFVVAFFGFVGALRENIVLLKIWHISLSVFLVAELIFGALVFVFYFFPGIRRDLNLAPEDWGLKEAIKKYKDDKGMRDWIDMVQREMKCCGVTNSDEGYRDWQNNQYYKCSITNPSPDRCSVPPSCCIIKPGDYYNSMCGYNTNNREVWEVETDIYTQGCVQGFGKWLQKNAAIIAAVFTGIVVPQFIGIVMARVYIKLTTTKHVQSRWKKWKIRSLARTEKNEVEEATEV